MLAANPFYPNLLHLLPLLHHIQTKNRFRDDFHHVLSFNHLLLGILIAKILYPKLNQLLVPVQFVPFILKIQTLHLASMHGLCAHHSFELKLRYQYGHKQALLVDLF